VTAVTDYYVDLQSILRGTCVSLTVRFLGVIPIAGEYCRIKLVEASEHGCCLVGFMYATYFLLELHWILLIGSSLGDCLLCSETADHDSLVDLSLVHPFGGGLSASLARAVAIFMLAPKSGCD
jgi:hypothetical protein